MCASFPLFYFILRTTKRNTIHFIYSLPSKTQWRELKISIIYTFIIKTKLINWLHPTHCALFLSSTLSKLYFSLPVTAHNSSKHKTQKGMTWTQISSHFFLSISFRDSMHPKQRKKDIRLRVTLWVQHNLWGPIPAGGNILCQESSVVVVRVSNPCKSKITNLCPTGNHVYHLYSLCWKNSVCYRLCMENTMKKIYYRQYHVKLNNINS